MPDKLIIKDLVAQCRIGAFEWEQANPQNIWIDLELAIDAAKAATQDDLQQAIDYGWLVTSVKQHVQHKPFRLLETLAEELASLILKTFSVSQVTVRVKKRSLPGIDFAAVEITRPTTG